LSRFRLARTFLVTVGVLALLSVGSAQGADVGSIHFTLGSKRMEKEWSLDGPTVTAGGDTITLDRPSQIGLGVESTWGRPGWPVFVALDVLHSADDGLQHFPAVNLGSFQIPRTTLVQRASTLEIALGIRRAWRFHGFGPYLGAGGTLIQTNRIQEMYQPEQANPVVRSSAVRGSGAGYWIGGGLLMSMGGGLHYGVAMRLSRAKVKIPDVRVVGETGAYQFYSPGTESEVEAGGRHVMFIIGWSLPTRK
jgi:hypothetical protein